jgi:uncharacterized protein YdaU (DUF1376 family)
MSEFAFLPLSTDAYLADTRHLSAQQHGAYLLLLMMAWRMPNCHLPDDDGKLAKWACVDRRTWLRIKPIVMDFWTLGPDGWAQKRLSKEREYVSKRAEISRQNGAAGGRPKSLTSKELQNPAGGLEQTQPITTLTLTPLNTPISPSGIGRASSSKRGKYGDPNDPIFAEFQNSIWSKRWPRPNNNPNAAFKAWAKLTDAERDQCRARIERCAAAIVGERSDPKYRPMLSTWINQRGWLAIDDATPAARAINWAKNADYFRETGEWPMGWGPRPGQPGCRCPSELLIGIAAA